MSSGPNFLPLLVLFVIVAVIIGIWQLKKANRGSKNKSSKDNPSNW